MAIANIFVPPEPPKGGGGGLMGLVSQGLGGLITLGSVIAAPFTGGASMAGVPYGTGLMAGGTALGAVVDPVEAAMPGTPRQGANVSQTAASERLKQDPKAVVASLNESMSALKSSSNKTQQALMPFLTSARDQMMKGIM